MSSSWLRTRPLCQAGVYQELTAGSRALCYQSKRSRLPGVPALSLNFCLYPTYLLFPSARTSLWLLVVIDLSSPCVHLHGANLVGAAVSALEAADKRLWSYPVRVALERDAWNTPRLRRGGTCSVPVHTGESHEEKDAGSQGRECLRGRGQGTLENVSLRRRHWKRDLSDEVPALQGLGEGAKGRGGHSRYGNSKCKGHGAGKRAVCSWNRKKIPGSPQLPPFPMTQ